MDKSPPTAPEVDPEDLAHVCEERALLHEARKRLLPSSRQAAMCKEDPVPWTRSQLDAALQSLDRDIDPLRDRATDMDTFWAEFEQQARHIQREADGEIWYAAAQIDRMLIRHGLMPRPGVYRLPRRRLPFATSPDDGDGIRAA